MLDSDRFDTQLTEQIHVPSFGQVKEWVQNPERQEAFFQTLQKYVEIQKPIYNFKIDTNTETYSGSGACDPAAQALAHALKTNFGLSEEDVLVVHGFYRDGLISVDDAWVRLKLNGGQYFFHPTFGQFDLESAKKIICGDLNEEEKKGLVVNEAQIHPEGFLARLSNIGIDEGVDAQRAYEQIYEELIKSYPSDDLKQSV